MMLPQGVGGCQYLPARLLGGHGGANYWKRGLAVISRSNCLQLAASRLTPPKNRLCRRFCMSWPDARTGTSGERAAAQDTWRLANRSIKCSVCVCRFRWSARLAILWTVVFWGVARACGEAASSVPRHVTPIGMSRPVTIVLVSGIPEYPQHPLIQACRFNSRLQSISYRSSSRAHHA